LIRGHATCSYIALLPRHR